MTVDTANRRTSVSRDIAAPPERIFAVLADAAQHALIDGSGSVQSAVGEPEPLELGSKFGMKMRIGFPYRITNEVVEFEPDRLIAWRHMGGHRWRFELEPVEGAPGVTRVTESFDWSTSRAPKVLELAGYPARHEGNIERTLERLDAHVTGGSATP